MQMQRLRQTWPFQALGDETRFRVIRLLAAGGMPLSAGQVAMALNISPSGLSRHLQILEIAGLTRTEREGRKYYIGVCAAHPSVKSLCAAVLSMKDETGILAEDMARLYALPDTEAGPDPHSNSGSLGGSDLSGSLL